MKTESEIEQHIVQLQHEIEVMVNYLYIKANNKDWHGIEDAGSDIRDIEAKIEALNFVLDKK